MKRLILLVAILTTTLNATAQDYIKSDKTADGIRNVEALPAIFEHQTELYLTAWNYIGSKSQNVDNYYLAIMCSEQVAPWNVSAGDKAYLGLLMEDEYIEVTALMDAKPESYATSSGTLYRTMAYYLIPKSAYDKLYKGFDRFKIDVRVKNTTPITLAVKLPFSSVEHMLMSYVEIMSETGR